jgi:hypothetical protein
MARSLTVISLQLQSTTHCRYRVYTRFLLTYTAIYRGNRKVLPMGITALQPQSHFHLGKPYIFSLSIFVIKNKHPYNTNNQIHSVHTRVKTNLHPPIANLTKFQKGVYYSGINIFNNLPRDIKDLANEITLFQNALKRFLLIIFL